MAEKDVLTTIIMPAYNRAGLIPRSIKSVLRQTRPDFELIIIDDASTDNTEEVVRGFEDPRIKYLRRPVNHLYLLARTGQGDNPRNDGLRQARGRYIAYLDSDDMYRTNFLEVMTGFMADNPEVDLAYCDAIWHRNLDGKGETANCNLSIDFGPKIMRIRNIIRTPTVMHKREVTAKVGYFNPIHSKVPHAGVDYVGPEDWDYWFRISEQFKVKHHPAILVHKINKTSDHYHDPDFDPESEEKQIPDRLEPPAAREVFYQVKIVKEYLSAAKRLEDVDGYLLPAEGYALMLLAAHGAGTGEIVEIGSFLGLSTCWLALGAKQAGREKVTAVDHFQGSPEHQRGAMAECKVLVRKGTTFHRFKQHISSAGLEDYIEPIVATSEEAVKHWHKPIRLLFIDAEHSYDSVRRDFELWSRFLLPGGYIAFHDVDWFPEVTRFYRDLLETRSDYREVLAVETLRMLKKAD